jgi:phosphoribosylaminoimidazole-succinocarboxamide synthase
MSNTLYQSELRLPLLNRGKVRDIHDLGDDLLLVTTDRLSAFDVVFPDPIPGKGEVLTTLSGFWFDRFRDFMPHHLIEVPDRMWLSLHTDEPERYEGRCMRVRRCEPIKLECIVRGSLEGSAWREYQKTGCIQEYPLRAGLKLHDELSKPLFTPSTKSDEGHDENITFAQACEVVGEELALKLRSVSIEIFVHARDHLRTRGITLADTKFEFGLADGVLVWIDEALTPDSSRFLTRDAAGEVVSLDKQFVRDWAEASGWDKKPPAPNLPPDVIAQTAARYREIRDLVMGKGIA